jgi:hypothetical protein
MGAGSEQTGFSGDGSLTVREPLFDPASVPSDVRSPDRVTEVNTLIARLRSYLVDRVEMQEAEHRLSGLDDGSGL